MDCPRGPAEIITDGWNGRLIPDGDIAGFTEALRGLVSDVELRRRMGAAALEHGRSYEMDRIGEAVGGAHRPADGGAQPAPAGRVRRRDTVDSPG